MLHHPLIQELHGLRLRGMASALEHQCVTPDIAALNRPGFCGGHLV